jgi:RHS repeat-associated protein
VDQTGSLANLRRHDYLPFGEELFADTGGRSPAQGYSPGDGVRQQFTQKERDNETELDYFLARYYASGQGRFTSPDAYFGRLTDPQTLNLYSYVKNNPLKYIDPTGHQDEFPRKKGKKGNGDDTDCDGCIAVIDHWEERPPGPVPQPHPEPTPMPPGPTPEQQRRKQQRVNEEFYFWFYDFMNRRETPFMLALPAAIPYAGDPFVDPEPLTVTVLEESEVIASTGVAATAPKIASASELLMPQGNLIGQAGSSSRIRVLQGGLTEAQTFFDKLAQGGQIVPNAKYPGTLVNLPNGGTVGLRTVMSRSPNSAATIDVNISGITVKKIKFNP